MDEQGFWRRVFEKCRSTVFSLSFWIGMTMGFPLEHVLWEKVWPFKIISKWLGL